MEAPNIQPNNEKILITGISGFLGQYLLSSFSGKYIIGVYHRKRVEVPQGIAVRLDLTNPVSVSNVFKHNKIKCVIHAAATTDLDFCEENEEASRLTNYVATENLIDNCLRYNSKLIYLSTDAVFSGEKETYDEKETPDPISVYGKHKYLSEQAISSLLSNYMICRLSKLIGGGFGNILSSILDGIKTNCDLILYNDIYRTPISGLVASEIILKLFKLGQGTYHISGPQKISWFEFGNIVANSIGLMQNKIYGVSIKNSSRNKIRPRKLYLQSNRLNEFGIQVPSLREQVVDLINYHRMI